MRKQEKQIRLMNGSERKKKVRESDRFDRENITKLAGAFMQEYKQSVENFWKRKMEVEWGRVVIEWESGE